MNTYTNALHPDKKLHRTVRKNLLRSTAIKAITLALITAIAIAIYMTNQSAVAGNYAAVPFSNALELQYARPWLEAQNKPLVEYSNALEMQYAQPWLQAQNKPVVVSGNAMELRYAQPWLDRAQQLVAVTGTSSLGCGSSLEMFYACKYGYGRP